MKADLKVNHIQNAKDILRRHIDQSLDRRKFMLLLKKKVNFFFRPFW